MSVGKVPQKASTIKAKFLIDFASWLQALLYLKSSSVYTLSFLPQTEDDVTSPITAGCEQTRESKDYIEGTRI